jgi:hypothetical protein
MATTVTHTTLRLMLERLVRQAVKRDVSAEVAEKAREATARAFVGLREQGVHKLRRRAEAYFGSIVRREIVRRRACATASARLIATTVAEDLARSGRSPEDIWDELRRGWGHAIPAEVLEEFRPAHARDIAA